MKILLFVLAFLGVSAFASKPGKGPPGPRHPPPPKRHSPNQNDDNKSGWGWNGSNEPLHYEKPPACLDRASIPPTKETGNCGNYSFFNMDRLWYISFGTAYGFNLFYRAFNGRPATKQSQIDEMCPASIFGIGPIVINSGSGVQFQQYCDSNVGVCNTTKDASTYDQGVDPYVLEHQEYYFIETDCKTYVIYYNCNDYTHGDLQLVTTRPYISPDLMKTFLSYFPFYKIPISQAQGAICSPPKMGPYPPPLQNYPNFAGGPNGWGQSGWDSTVSTDGWSANNGWSDNSNGWSPSPPSNGWSNNGWGLDNQGWSAKIEKKEEVKKTEASQEGAAEVMAEVAL